jgi:hypothetical protein
MLLSSLRAGTRIETFGKTDGGTCRLDRWITVRLLRMIRSTNAWKKMRWIMSSWVR